MCSRDDLSPEVVDAAEALWNYHCLGREVMKSEGVLVFGSNDLRVARHAAELFHRGMAPWILFSGARGRMTEHWPETEARAMARIARECEVPGAHILIEDRATNTGENIRFSRELLAARGIRMTTGIVVQKPYMERRSIAALEVQWPEVAFRASSPEGDLAAYCTGEFPLGMVISAMVADFQRILEYPALGYARVQPVPDEVMAAYDLLRSSGFD